VKSAESDGNPILDGISKLFGEDQRASGDLFSPENILQLLNLQKTTTTTPKPHTFVEKLLLSLAQPIKTELRKMDEVISVIITNI